MIESVRRPSAKLNHGFCAAGQRQGRENRVGGDADHVCRCAIEKVLSVDAVLIFRLYERAIVAWRLAALWLWALAHQNPHEVILSLDRAGVGLASGNYWCINPLATAA